MFGRNQPLAPDSFTLALVHGGAVPTSPGALPLCPTSLAASLGHGEAPTAQGSKGCLFPGRAGIPRGLAGRSAMSTGQGDYAGQKPVGGGGGGNRRQLPLRRHKDLNPWQRRGEKPAPGQADPSDRSPCTPRQQEPQARSHHNRVSSGLASGGSGRRRPRQSAGGFPPPGQVSAVQPVSGGTEGSGRGGGRLTRLTPGLPIGCCGPSPSPLTICMPWGRSCCRTSQCRPPSASTKTRAARRMKKRRMKKRRQRQGPCLQAPRRMQTVLPGRHEGTAEVRAATGTGPGDTGPQL